MLDAIERGAVDDRERPRAIEVLAPFSTAEQLRQALIQLSRDDSSSNDGTWMALEQCAARLDEDELIHGLRLAFPDGSDEMTDDNEEGSGAWFGKAARQLSICDRDKMIVAIARKRPRTVWTVQAYLVDEQKRAQFFVAVWAGLPESLHDAVLRAALALGDDARSKAIEGLAPMLDEAQAVTVVHEGLAFAIEWRRFKALASLVVSLPPPRGAEALEEICGALPLRSDPDGGSTSDVIRRIARHLDEDQAVLALDAVIQIPYILPTVRGCCALLPYLPALARAKASQDVLDLASKLERERDREEAFRLLAATPVGDLRSMGLEEVLANDWGTPNLVSDILAASNEGCFADACAVALRSGGRRSAVLDRLAKVALEQLNPEAASDMERLVRIWACCLHGLGGQSGQRFFEELDKIFSLAVAVGGTEILRPFFDSVETVRRWWP
jgi:hypothetical protein